MEILQVIQDDDYLCIFTSNPKEDILIFQDKYESESKIHLWYKLPERYIFTFLWKAYDCIRLWYDKEEDAIESSKIAFTNLLNKI